MPVSHMPPPNVNKSATLALKPRKDITRSPKQGYQCLHKIDLCSPKVYFKKIVKLIASHDLSKKSYNGLKQAIILHTFTILCISYPFCW